MFKVLALRIPQIPRRAAIRAVQSIVDRELSPAADDQYLLSSALRGRGKIVEETRANASTTATTVKNLLYLAHNTLILRAKVRRTRHSVRLEKLEKLEPKNSPSGRSS